MLTLQPKEKIWLKDYCAALREKHAADVLRVAVFGSKARGDAHQESDLDVLVILRGGDWRLEESIRGIGYGHQLSTFGEVTPTIMTFTQEKWESSKARGFPFQREVERDAVEVYE